MVRIKRIKLTSNSHASVLDSKGGGGPYFLKNRILTLDSQVMWSLNLTSFDLNGGKKTPSPQKQLTLTVPNQSLVTSKEIL